LLSTTPTKHFTQINWLNILTEERRQHSLSLYFYSIVRSCEDWRTYKIVQYRKNEKFPANG